MKILLSFLFVFLLGYSALAQTVTRTIVRSSVQTPNDGMAPDFNVTSIDGKVFDSKALRGKVVVLNLWFVNCPYCVQEIALLNPIVDKYKDAVFIGMSVNSKPQLQSFLKNNPFKYNIIPGAGQLMLFKFGEGDKNGNFDLKFPLHVVIDRQGKQVVKMQGVKGVDAVRQELEKQFK
jgi:peroxiredoxin